MKVTLHQWFGALNHSACWPLASVPVQESKFTPTLMELHNGAYSVWYLRLAFSSLPCTLGTTGCCPKLGPLVSTYCHCLSHCFPGFLSSDNPSAGHHYPWSLQWSPISRSLGWGRDQRWNPHPAQLPLLSILPSVTLCSCCLLTLSWSLHIQSVFGYLIYHLLYSQISPPTREIFFSQPSHLHISQTLLLPTPSCWWPSSIFHPGMYFHGYIDPSRAAPHGTPASPSSSLTPTLAVRPRSSRFCWLRLHLPAA